MRRARSGFREPEVGEGLESVGVWVVVIEPGFQQHELGKGNLNPGTGTRPIGKGISEARARDGARVYFRVVDGKVEVLGKSHKGNQPEVIKEVLKVFGGP
ncbi:MAG: hypothetical protein AAGA48_38380 [Myxococcota bacterium]